MSYNLLEEKWLPVLWKDGKTSRVGVIEALEYAGEIRCITLASPLDLFSAHRFILTLLYWKAGGMQQVRESLLKYEKIPTTVLNDIKKEGYYFDLFDSKSPFMQDPSVCNGGKKKSCGSLFAELATGTNIAHFHHGDDENMRLCMRCVTLGMLRVVPWSQAGGRGLTPSVHNAPPIMAIAFGDNLAITLGLNLVPLDVPAGKANWSGHFKPTDSTPIPYLEALTWNPRRICLSAPKENDGICWRCGHNGVPLVGKIVYLENDYTKLFKKAGKSIPFCWKDPSAFYPVDEYKTIRSYSEVLAMDNKDMGLLLEKNTGKKKRERPESFVVRENMGHKGWQLIVPCTNPANNKTFDHRQIELLEFTPESIKALIPGDRPSERQGFDGWKEPELDHPNGIKHFVQAAVRLLALNDWAALSNAAFREMHESPGAFDVFSGLYWGVRGKITRLPARNVAWLMLKLMAAVPASVRVIRSGAKFNPLQSLPKRQINGRRGKRFYYPVSFPRGPRLEASLRDILDRNMRKRHPEAVDWIGLCSRLDQLLN